MSTLLSSPAGQTAQRQRQRHDDVAKHLIRHDIEESVLGCILLAGFDDDRLTPEVFASTTHRQIYQAALSVRYEGGDTSNPNTVAAELEKRGQFEEIGVHGIVRLLEAVHSTAHFTDDVTQLVGLYQRRRSHELLTLAAQQAANPAYDLDSVDQLCEAVLRRDDAKPNPRPFDEMSWAELDAGDFELAYAIDGWLVEQQPFVIGGPKKGLKTGISTDLAISLATGGWFLQKFKVNRRYKVAFLSGESGKGTIQETARRIGRAKDVGDVRDVSNLKFGFRLPKLGDPGWDRALRKFIEKNELEFIIIDPLYMALQEPDPGNLFAMGKQLNTLSAILADTGCTPGLNHHYKKGAEVGKEPDLDWLAWAGLAEWARQWILLNRREDFDKDRGFHQLWASVGGSAGHCGFWGVDVEEGTRMTPGGRFWIPEVLSASDANQSSKNHKEVARESAKEVAAAAKVEAHHAKLMKGFALSPHEGDSRSEIIRRAQLNPNDGKNALEAAIRRGLVEPCEIIKGNKKKPFEGVRLKPTPTTPTDQQLVGLSDW